MKKITNMIFSFKLQIWFFFNYF